MNQGYVSEPFAGHQSKLENPNATSSTNLGQTYGEESKKSIVAKIELPISSDYPRLVFRNLKEEKVLHKKKARSIEKSNQRQSINLHKRVAVRP